MKRSSVLDILKSVAVVNMVAYHTLYDVVYIFGVPVSFMGTRASFVWQQAICWTFILVSGALSLSSRRPYRRAGCGEGRARRLFAPPRGTRAQAPSGQGRTAARERRRRRAGKKNAAIQFRTAAQERKRRFPAWICVEGIARCRTGAQKAAARENDKGGTLFGKALCI